MSDVVRTRSRVEVTGHAQNTLDAMLMLIDIDIGTRLAAWLTRDLVTLWLAACPL